MNRETKGLAYGFLGVLGFSLTLPATRIAVAELDPTIVGLGRALVAALLAGILLWITRQRLPTRNQLGSLLVVAGGVILGFPYLATWAMQHVPASHGAIVLAIIPLLTALAATLRMGERPSLSFWLAGAAGSAVVMVFAWISGAGQLHLADLALLGAAIAAAIGYAEGARLTQVMGGWQVISWALLAAVPFIIVPVSVAVAQHGLAASPGAWLNFAYVSVVSQFVAFFAWYKGLAIGGVARVGQIQLLQPFLTIIASGLLLGEAVTIFTWGTALIVIIIIALGRRATVQSRTQASLQEFS